MEILTEVENYNISTMPPSTGCYTLMVIDLNIARFTKYFQFRFNDFSEASMSLSVDTSSPQTRDRSSLIIMSLVEQLAAAYEQQEARRSALVLRLSQSLVKMGLVNPAFAMPELSGLRAQYSLAFLRLMSQVRHFKSLHVIRRAKAHHHLAAALCKRKYI